MIYQQTINGEVKASGVGLHSGNYIDMKLMPAPPNTGICFRRVDIESKPTTKANIDAVSSTLLGTTLGESGFTVATVEHLLASLLGMGIDNLFIELNNDEVPIFDGSAASFVFLIQEAGIQLQKEQRKYLKIKQKVEVMEGDKYASIIPYDGYRIRLKLSFNHPAVDEENKDYEYEFSTDSFLSKIAYARTFGFLKDIESLREKKLTLGGSVDNAIVLDENNVINIEGLRYKDEFIRHNILDVMGDLHLVGAPILGSFYGKKTGHSLNTELAKKILADEKNFEWVVLG